MNTMSFKALIGIALIVLIVQLVVSDAEPVGRRQGLQVRKRGVENALTIKQSHPGTSAVRLGRKNEKCPCNGNCQIKDCDCDCHGVAPAAK